MNTCQFLRTRAALTLGILLLIASPAAMGTTVILDETFEEGQRLAQDLPDTAAWYGSSGGGDPTLSQPAPGIITMDTTENTMLLTHFTDEDPASLEVGEELNFVFEFQMEGAVDRILAVRAGLLDSSEGERVTDDAQGTGHSRFQPYTGYAGFFNPGGTSMTLRERTDLTDSSLISRAGVWSSHVSDATPVIINEDTTYTGAFRIARVEEGVSATFSVSGGDLDAPVEVNYEDAGSELFSFDTFAVWINREGADSFSLTSVHATMRPIDGEPPGPSFALWQEEHFPDETDPAIIGPEAAPSGDGVANLLKYAFGLDPWTPSALGDQVEAEFADGALRLSYRKRIGAEDVDYVPEVSTDLSEWHSGPENIEELSINPLPGDEFQRITVRALVNADESRAFLRVRIPEN